MKKNHRGTGTQRRKSRIVALFFSVSLCLCGGISAREHPNVLVLIGDDHVPYVFGAYGNPKARTPNLDKFAATGIRFNHAYCNSPVCTASRQAFLTGRVPHAVGVTLLQTALGDEPLTLAELLGHEGYATAAFGKMHFNSDRHHGFEILYDTPQAVAEVKSRGVKPVASEIQIQPPWKPFKDPAKIWLNSANLPEGKHIEDMPGTLFADHALEYMRSHKDKPFLLFVSFTEPHSPYEYPVGYQGMFNPKDFDPPEPGPEDDDQIPQIFRDLTREEKQGIAAAYYTSTAFLDYNVGRVLKGLDELGLAGDTLVIYLGDNGYCLGHHGRFEKHCFFEEAVRCPLVIRWPGHTKTNAASEALVEFIDLFPTIAEICGILSPKDIEGQSLVSVLEGKTDKHRESVFSEYLENEEAMIRDSRYKLVYTSGNRERKDGYATGRPSKRNLTKIYDLEADPGEHRNIAETEEGLNVELRLKSSLLIRLNRGRTTSRKDMNNNRRYDVSLDMALNGFLAPPEADERRGN